MRFAELLALLTMGCSVQALVVGKDDVLPDTDDDRICGNGTCPPHMACGSLNDEPWCFPDADEDAVVDEDDNCPYFPNHSQSDADDDGVGDGCDLCPGPNDLDPCGDSCCADPDGDDIAGVSTHGFDEDNCPYQANPDQADDDDDGIGDACDLCPEEFNPLTPCGDPCLDSDGDTVADEDFCGGAQLDNCPLTPSESSNDLDEDGVGDVCDPDGVPPITRSAILLRLHRLGIVDDETFRLAATA